MAISSIQLEAFYAVAQTANFTKAAEKLNVTQSALSQRILNLEDELETSLFVRDRAGLRMTEAATRLLRYCQIKDDLEAEFISSLKSSEGISGIIRVAGFSSVLRSVVMPALADFVTKHRHLQIEFYTREIEDLLPMLKRGEVDFIVSNQNYQREELESISLGIERNVLVEKSGYVGDDIYLDHHERDQTTMDYFRLSRAKKETPRRRYLGDVYNLLEGVKLGYGRAVLPIHLIKNDKALSVLHPRTVLEIPVNLFYFRQPYYSKLSLAIVEELTRNSKRFLS